MKKITAIVLSMVMFFALSVPSLAATLSNKVNKTSVNTGEEVSVTLGYEENVTGVFGFQLEYGYNKENYEFVSGTWGKENSSLNSNLGGADLPNIVDSSKKDVVKIGFAVESATTINKGTVVTLVFKAKKDIEDVTNSGFTSSLKIFDETGTVIKDHTVNQGLTVVPDITLGDVNGDGVVDADDAKQLLNHVLFPDLFSLSDAAIEKGVDYNHDGIVDSVDAEMLLNYVLFPDLFPLE